ncbi:membrane hypothetical protein [Candidatus Terasakiella magnetica]|uniref:Membrane insertase YidC/Oxa/ALB C-terminal domain-containing protein n=1 Tax=Candidatus Terasakiella magnetica TaxID=1867952 RepID=A0A1C3RG48_9PROT|nr:YidC/Oxa1 family membrane protein insertase [Candidatus Terasakiella magnetica]SCA56273.1 membrane hypothetical protein [Candidatus Terasakiella magnetica]
MLNYIVSLYADFFLLIVSLVDSYGGAIICLSFLSALVMSPLTKRAAKVSHTERAYQDVLVSQIEDMKEKLHGEAFHKELRLLYKRYSYHPIYAVRLVLPLFVQLPFLIATYFMLTGLSQLEGQSFLFIRDLGQADQLLAGMNILPVVMTVVNILAALTLANAQKKEIYQSIVISLLFLIALYEANAGILLYWTFNNLILLGRNIFALQHKHQKMNIAFNDLVDMEKIKKNIPNISLFMAFVFCFLTVQAFAELASIEDTPNILVRIILFFAVATFSFSFISVFVSRFRLNIYVIGAAVVFVSAIAVIFVFFFKELRHYLSGLIDLIFYYNMVPLYIIPLVVLLVSALGCFFLIKKQEDFSQKKYIFFSIAAVLAALAFHWLNNSAFIFASTAPLYFGIGILFALCFSVFSMPYVRGLSGWVAWEIVGSVVLFSFVMLPTVHGILIWSSYYAEYALVLSITYVFFTFLYRQGTKVLYSFFILFFLINISILGIQTLTTHKDKVVGSDFAGRSGVEEIQSLIKKTQTGLTATPQTPNIYYIVSESMPDLRTLQKLGIDHKPLQDLFEKYNFTTYDDTYSVGPFSLSSMSKTMGLKDGITDGNEMRKIVGGQSIANLWLKDMGYETAIVTKTFMTGIYNWYNNRLPPVSVEAGQMDFLFMLLKGISLREFKFDIKGLTKYGAKFDYERVKHDLIRQDKQSPLFMLYHGEYPGHSQNSGQCLPDEKEQFIERYKIAIDYLEEDFRLIKEHDPAAIIIVIGDHGPYLTLNCHTLNYMDPKKVTELHMRDRVGTIFAVHWPDQEKAQKYDQDVLINQDIFPVVFSYLYDSEVPLSLRMDPTVELGGRMIKGGKFIPLNHAK